MKALLKRLRRASATLRGWRTVAFNALLASGSAALLFIAELRYVDLSEILPAKVLPYVTLGIAVAGIVLRIYTSAPVGRPRRDSYEQYPRDYRTPDNEYGSQRNPKDARSSRRKSRPPVEPELD